MTAQWVPAFGEPGEVVTALVRNPLENPDATGKLRPVILVRRQASSWLVMGLTTNSAYRSGAARTAIPNPTAVGLDGAGYPWGSRLTPVSVLDLERHVGWVDAALTSAVILAARLRPEDAAVLVLALGSATAPAA